MAKDQNTIPGNDFFKSLGKLEALAKGNQEPEDVNKSQLFHTKANSEQNSWAGGDTTKFGNNWDDNIGSDGTDYKPSRKSIAEKVMKGEALSPEEVSLLKSDAEKGLEKGNDDSDKPAKEEKEKACDMAKSFSNTVAENQTLTEALEMSDFLQEFAKAFGTGLGELETRTADMIEKGFNAIIEHVNEAIEAKFAEQGEFNKSLAEAVVNIGHGVAGSISQAEEAANQPAAAPKSQLVSVPGGQQVMNKSFAGPAGAEISKAQKLDMLTDMVTKGQLSSTEVIKYETTGQLRPDLDAQVVRLIQSGGTN